MAAGLNKRESRRSRGKKGRDKRRRAKNMRDEHARDRGDGDGLRGYTATHAEDIFFLFLYVAMLPERGAYPLLLFL